MNILKKFNFCHSLFAHEEKSYIFEITDSSLIKTRFLYSWESNSHQFACFTLDLRKWIIISKSFLWRFLTLVDNFVSIQKGFIEFSINFLISRRIVKWYMWATSMLSLTILKVAFWRSFWADRCHDETSAREELAAQNVSEFDCRYYCSNFACALRIELITFKR